LGIPNVVVDETLLPMLQDKLGQSVVLAASPRGIVRLFEDAPQWDSLFCDGNGSPGPLLQPDLTRLDLASRRIIPLTQIRESDVGRRAGPKAAHLGELKHHYPQAVADGLVIPFGVFNALLDHPVAPQGPSMRQWIADEYRRLAAWTGNPEAKRQAVAAFLETVRDWIGRTDPGAAFREQLRTAMQTTFGEDGSYGVFVRSDTNVEDLPGFAGAGLNLTLPNVVTFKRVLEAIQQVWASPFTERAYGWRQARMSNPVDVYPSVLLLRSVPVEKSGVLVSVDIDTGQSDYLSIAVNEGIGGAVAGQLAEELRVDVATGELRLLAEAAQPSQRVLRPGGGLERVPASGGERVLTDAEIEKLLALAADLPRHFASLRDAAGRPVPADVEFGFLRGELKLFQVRPYAESKATLGNAYLLALDRALEDTDERTVPLDQVP
jgi:phosphoenolpyruvate synthase/pyruvate phosphate dikinase